MNDQQTQVLADEMAIRNLVAHLALLADRAPDLKEYLDCFTEDAIWEYAEAARARVKDGQEGLRLVGRAAIETDRLRLRGERFQGPSGKRFHVNTTLEVTVHGDGTAEAQSYWLFVDGEGTPPQVRRIGHYHDRFRKAASGWKLAHRTVSPADM
jgi:hypothetical protein